MRTTPPLTPSLGSDRGPLDVVQVAREADDRILQPENCLNRRAARTPSISRSSLKDASQSCNEEEAALRRRATLLCVPCARGTDF